MKQEYLSFPGLVEELKKLCFQKESGTLFIATNTNRSAQVMVDSGEIVYAFCFNKRGKEAINLLTTINSGKCRFQPRSTALRKDPSLVTDDIFRVFAETNDDVKSYKAPEVVFDQSPVSSSDNENISLNDREVLQRSLTQYVGPMAAVICEDHLTASINLTTAIELLASEIPSEELAEVFKKAVKEELHQ